MGNLMKMCKACNQGAGKHFGSLAEWLTGNPFYGKSLADTFSRAPELPGLSTRTLPAKPLRK